MNMLSVRFIVSGSSMEPTLSSNQFLIVSRLHYVIGRPERGDVAVFHFPANPQQDYIKRVIGLPSETVEIRDTNIYINGMILDEPYLGEPCVPIHCFDGFWQLGENEYFVMGDNRNLSEDSRAFGPVKHNLFVGEAILRYWPLAKLATIHQIGSAND